MHLFLKLDFGRRRRPISNFFYYRPALGRPTHRYFQPDGTSLYIRPE